MKEYIFERQDGDFVEEAYHLEGNEDAISCIRGAWERLTKQEQEKQKIFRISAVDGDFIFDCIADAKAKKVAEDVAAEHGVYYDPEPITIEDDGKKYDGYIVGDDEMWEINEFYQYFITVNDRYALVFKAYYHLPESGEVDCIDYTKPYKLDQEYSVGL